MIIKTRSIQPVLKMAPQKTLTNTPVSLGFLVNRFMILMNFKDSSIKQSKVKILFDVKEQIILVLSIEDSWLSECFLLCLK
jgi:hypothetical protein